MQIKRKRSAPISASTGRQPTAWRRVELRSRSAPRCPPASYLPPCLLISWWWLRIAHCSISFGAMTSFLWTLLTPRSRYHSKHWIGNASQTQPGNSCLPGCVGQRSLPVPTRSDASLTLKPVRHLRPRKRSPVFLIGSQCGRYAFLFASLAAELIDAIRVGKDLSFDAAVASPRG